MYFFFIRVGDGDEGGLIKSRVFLYLYLHPYLHLYLYLCVGNGDEGGLIKCSVFLYLHLYLHLYFFFICVGNGDEGGLIKCRVFRDPDNTSGGRCWSVRYTQLGHECFSSFYLSIYQKRKRKKSAGQTDTPN